MELELGQVDRKYEQLRVRDRNAQSRLMASLVEHGQRSPALVVESEGRYVLIDGYRRASALSDLGRDTMLTTVLELDETEALLLSHQLMTGGRRNVLEEAWLLRELVEVHGLSQRELAIELGHSASWVSRRLALLRDVSEEVEQAMRAGKLSPQLVMKYMVPMARANPEHCQRLVASLGGERVSVREMARLYAGWRVGTEEQRCHIVDNPRLYLRLDGALEPSSGKPLPGEEREQEIVRRLGAVTAVCLRLRQLVRERCEQEGSTPLPAVVHFAFAEAQAGFQALTACFADRQGHA